jgi:hypothetical protein
MRYWACPKLLSVKRADLHVVRNWSPVCRNFRLLLTILGAPFIGLEHVFEFSASFAALATRNLTAPEPCQRPPPPKGMGLMALTGRRPAEIFFSASLRKNSPIPPSSSTANSKPAKLPVPAPSPTSSRPRRPQENRPSPRPTPVVKEFPFPRSRQHHHRSPACSAPLFFVGLAVAAREHKTPGPKTSPISGPD